MERNGQETAVLVQVLVIGGTNIDGFYVQEILRQNNATENINPLKNSASLLIFPHNIDTQMQSNRFIGSEYSETPI
jgi:hypothetical protein